MVICFFKKLIIILKGVLHLINYKMTYNIILSLFILHASYVVVFYFTFFVDCIVILIIWVHNGLAQFYKRFRKPCTLTLRI
jgi:hypothetical protein